MAYNAFDEGTTIKANLIRLMKWPYLPDRTLSRMSHFYEMRQLVGYSTRH